MRISVNHMKWSAFLTMFMFMWLSFTKPSEITLQQKQPEVYLCDVPELHTSGVYFCCVSGDLFTEAADAAMEAMKGRLANQYYMKAEEAWSMMEEWSSWFAKTDGSYFAPGSCLHDLYQCLKNAFLESGTMTLRSFLECDRNKDSILRCYIKTLWVYFSWINKFVINK